MAPRYHAILFPSGAGVAGIEALRRTWDPTMAAQIAAHITIVYPDEHPGLAALRERAASVAARQTPFRLRLGDFRAFPPPDEACVYVEVLDPERRFAALREALTAPRFRPVAFPPHLTIIHPRTSDSAAKFWRTGAAGRQSSEVTIDTIVVTASEGAGYAVEAQYPLGG